MPNYGVDVVNSTQDFQINYDAGILLYWNFSMYPKSKIVNWENDKG